MSTPSRQWAPAKGRGHRDPSFAELAVASKETARLAKGEAPVRHPRMVVHRSYAKPRREVRIQHQQQRKNPLQATDSDLGPHQRCTAANSHDDFEGAAGDQGFCPSVIGKLRQKTWQLRHLGHVQRHFWRRKGPHRQQHTV